VEAEIAALNSQLTEELVPDPKIESVLEYYHNIQDGLDFFRFEDRRLTLEMLNISFRVERGEARAQDCLIGRGLVPETSLSFHAGTPLPDVPGSRPRPAGQS
jgi:hypothetical protein